MIVLADTSVWIHHWRRGDPRFARLLEQDRIVVHPFVFGELALGSIAPRAPVLGLLGALETPRLAEHDEVLALIERVPLSSRGIGWVDAHLLASALLDRIRLWTLDRRLAQVADELNLTPELSGLKRPAASDSTVPQFSGLARPNPTRTFSASTPCCSYSGPAPKHPRPPSLGSPRGPCLHRATGVSRCRRGSHRTRSPPCAGSTTSSSDTVGRCSRMPSASGNRT